MSSTLLEALLWLLGRRRPFLVARVRLRCVAWKKDFLLFPGPRKKKFSSAIGSLDPERGALEACTLRALRVYLSAGAVRHVLTRGRPPARR